MAPALSLDNVPVSPLRTVLNFRDIGTTVNQLSHTEVLRDAHIFRSARPDDASEADRTALQSSYNIRTMIDLRSATEHAEQADKLARTAKATSTQKPIDYKIPGVRYSEISLTDGAFSRALLWQLKWPSLVKLFSLMAVGYRTQAISVLGREFMAPRGLIGLCRDTLDYSKDGIGKVFAVFADEDSYPVLVHCTQGKDRTGLVVMLLLLLLGVDVGVIHADYMASQRELEAEREQRLREIRAIGMNDDCGLCGGVCGAGEGVCG